MIPFDKIDKSWTLFLDRDGVVNVEVVGDYITRWEDFRFYEGVLRALRIFAGRFGRIIMVTNQRGVSKGLMTEHDLKDIHLHMLGSIEANGGRIDRIYYCIDMEGPNRKPNPGMGWKAKKDFPGIEFSKSVMIGNTMGDMEFGRNIGAYTVFIATNRTPPELPDRFTDAVYSSLIKVAEEMDGKDV
ncbi:MAG: HAD-IIIA family hydrolase [Chitinophagaceae bacterium]|nr:HAD-IIIA family hydrolase [Chitinophagaceae bacterium]